MRFRRAVGASIAVALFGLASVSVGAAGARAADCDHLTSLAPLQSLPHCNLNQAAIGTTLGLADSNLADANLDHAVVAGQAALLDSDLSGANLNQVQISGLDALVQADLTYVNLNGARISGNAVGVAADLARANLNHAVIGGLGDLVAADLTGAHLHGATISGTGALTGADLTGADMRGATVTGLDALFDATYAHTICPDGTNSDRDGNSCGGHLAAAGPHARSVMRALAIPAGVVGGGGGGSSGPASQLVFLIEPLSGTVAGSQFGVSVAVEDSSGNVVSTDSSTSVTLAIGANPSAGALSCATNPVTVTDGVAHFACSVSPPGSGYTLAAASSPAYTPAASDPFDVTATPPAPPPGTVLGGLNLDAYCQSIGYSYSHVPGVGTHLANVEFGPDQAFAWYCVNFSGPAGTPFNMQAACSHQYGTAALAFVENPDDAYSWVCVEAPTASSGYYDTTDTGAYLAFEGSGGGGLADFAFVGTDGSLTFEGSGSASRPDVISSSGNGTDVTYSTPLGGFEVAESGSLATGGAI